MFKLRSIPIICFCSLFYIFCFSTVGSGQKSHDRNFLSEKLISSGFGNRESGLALWRAGQKKLYLQKLQALPDSIKSFYLSKADSAQSFKWPALLASRYLEYKQRGNRVNYEREQENRNNQLNSLVIGALIARDKKYLRQIVNGLWAVMEQSSWEIPAITGLQQIGTDLPDPREQVIGLVGAETAVNIATIGYMLHDELESVSPVINVRIKKELEQRLLIPYMQRSDFWWMGLNGQQVNNWNAWINTNVLITALFSVSDEDKLNLLIKKVLKSTDQFINQYPDDGGCDEGPAYWSIASGKLITMLRFLNGISAGKLSWEGNPLLQNMGSYIYKMHIDGDYFVNFADASPKVIPNPASVYGFGKMFQDDSLRLFGAYLLALNKHRLPEVNLADFLEAAVMFDEMAATQLRSVKTEAAFLPDLEVYAARSGPKSDKGLFLAVEGGNNDQSHNHNDIGNFILYADGKPVIVDAGVGTYTALTFSQRRYELWNMQSGWHNCPLINGTMQEAGKKFKATDISYTGNNRRVRIDMDIANAYPEPAFVEKWERSFVLDRREGTGGSIELNENFVMTKRVGKTVIHFLSYCTVEEQKKGRLIFFNKSARPVLFMSYDHTKTTFSVETKILTDPKMIGNWGGKLYRLSFVLNSTALKGHHSFKFKNTPD